MRQPVLEGVTLSTAVEQASFIVAVAEAYDAAPAHDPRADQAWQILIHHTQLVLYKRLKGSGIKVSFQAEDPYDDNGESGAAMKYMLYDIVMNNRLRIYSGHSDNHPTFSADENVVFRAVHDFFTHATVRRQFTTGLKKAAKEMKLREWPTIEEAGPLLSRVKLNSKAFNARGEFNATSDHMRLAPKGARAAIFTEVTGQVSYQVIMGDFPQQKVAILPGFDYERIGTCLPGSAQQARKEEVAKAIKQGGDIALKMKGRSSISAKELLAATTRANSK